MFKFKHLFIGLGLFVGALCLTTPVSAQASDGTYIITASNCILPTGPQCAASVGIRLYSDKNSPTPVPDYKYVSGTKYDFNGGVSLASTIHVTSANPSQGAGVINGIKRTLTLDNVGIFTTAFPPGVIPENASTQVIKVNAKINFTTFDPNLTVDRLPISIQVPGDIGPTTSPAVPDIANLTQPIVNYTVSETPEGPGMYTVCIKAPFLIASGNQICKQNQLKVKGKILTVSFAANGDMTKLASYVSPADDCNNASGVYGWILCPAFDMANKFLTLAYKNLVQPMLEVNPLNNNGDSNALRSVWSGFVSLADVLFVVLFMVLIFGTSLNLNSYTVKKMLPRLVIAVIAVQFSFFLCGVLVDIGNVFGDGIQSLVTTALYKPADVAGVSHPLAKNLISGGTTIIAGGVVATSALYFLGPTLLFMLLGLVMAVITFIFTLIVRKFIIDVLILLAPIAIVAWVLPNTSSLFKRWKDNLVKVIMVYPIIALLLAAGIVVQKSSGGVGATGVTQIIGGLAPIIVFFMMPKAFKWGGQAMGIAGNTITKHGNAMSSKAANSQTAKDMKATYRGKRAQGYLNAPTGKGFGARMARTRGMLGSGNILPTAASKRRVSSTAAGFEKTQGDEFQNQINNANGGTGFTDTEYENLLSGKDVGSIKSTAASRKRALAMAAKTGKWDAIRAAKASGKLDPGELTQGLAGTDAYEKAPDIGRNMPEVAQSMSAPQLQSSHKSTKVALANHVFGGASSATPGVVDQVAFDRLDRNLGQTRGSANMKANWDADAGKAFHDLALARSTAPGATTADRDNYSKILTHMNTDGTLK